MNAAEEAPKNLRVEQEPYPHLRDDDGCVLARDYEHEGKTAYIVRATNCHADLLAALKEFVVGYDRIPGPARDKMFADALAAIAKAAQPTA